ncbi:ferritin-like domain-containing protein [Mesobacillus stamsii]|uniref:DUF2202 domain-containing protein n=2 Tax=Mesobacillus TaxID=2675231 RepID=A0ABU0FTG9_9BACI|nr:hypothetical protein [Mesobacillus stamsii]MDQ0413222.1 hypothetical protein [Mesobacillus stamsii]
MNKKFMISTVAAIGLLTGGGILLANASSPAPQENTIQTTQAEETNTNTQVQGQQGKGQQGQGHQGQGQQGQGKGHNQVKPDLSQATSDHPSLSLVDPSLEEMLDFAIRDEYFALAEYEIIMEQFNVDSPFSNISEAEQHHIDLLVPLFSEYQLPMPEDTSKVEIPETLKEVYQMGVQAEIDNIKMYEFFLEQPDLPADVKDVFGKLMNASYNHLNAFQTELDKL